jgi:hypothetical protein
MGSNPSPGIMTILDRLKGQILWDRKNSLYDIWEGCYESNEYDFIARVELSKEYPETSWSNPEHENMLVDMAIDSHVPDWKDDYVKGGWTKEVVCADRLNDLYNYYCIWLYINKDIELR